MATESRNQNHTVDAVDRRIVALLFFGLLAAYLTVQYGVMQSWDGRINAGVAKNLWEHHRLEEFGDSFGVVGQSPLAYSKYAIGLSLLMAPMWQFDPGQGVDNAFWLTLVNPVLSAIAAVAVYLIGLHLRWSRSVAVITALVFGLLTMIPVYSTELLPDPGTTMCVTLFLLGVLRWRDVGPRNGWLVGTAVGGAILFRVESVVVVAPAIALVLLLVPGRELWRTRRQWLPGLLVPLAVVAVWILYYNDLRYGSPFDAGPDTGLFNFPIVDGIWRQLGSSGKGFFWYNPILLAALPGIVWLWRRERAVVAIVAVLFASRVLFFARFISPDGDVAWGPRYLLPGCALLAIGLGESLQHVARCAPMRRRLATASIAVLAAISGVVVVAGLWVPYTYSWGIVNNVPGYQSMAPGQAEAIVASQLERQNNDWYWSPIVLNLRGDAPPRPFLLRWWKGGPSVAGVLLAVAAVGTLSAAFRTSTARGSRMGVGRGGPLRLRV